MAASRTLDVTAFLDKGMTPFHRRLLIISCLVTFFDGLDFSLIAFTLPYLREPIICPRNAAELTKPVISSLSAICSRK